MSKPKAKSRIGRPLLDAGGAKDTVLTIRLSRSEREAIGVAASRAGVAKASDWARRVLLTAASGSR